MMGALTSKPTECSREAEIVAAVHAGRWPDDECAELVKHAGECGVCMEVAEVALCFDAERRILGNGVVVPSSARAWWRAQMRARLEAAEVASQPLTLAQGIGGTCAVALALLALRWAWPSASSLSDWSGRLAAEGTALLGSVNGDIVHLGLWLTLGLVVLVLVPVAVFYVLPED